MLPLYKSIFLNPKPQSIMILHPHAYCIIQICCCQRRSLRIVHVTRHTSHVTRHTLHVTRHTSHFSGRGESFFLIVWKSVGVQGCNRNVLTLMCCFDNFYMIVVGDDCGGGGGSDAHDDNE
jgi:hypothetical protein